MRERNDKDWVTINTIDVNKKLKEFLPVAEEDAALVLITRKEMWPTLQALFLIR